MISLASRAADLFERSNIDEKRQLLSFVYSNPNVRGTNLEFSVRSPFDLTVGREGYPSWLGDLETESAHLQAQDFRALRP